jgi:ribose/xylose/arabinose/galactoside ABC-type transport system permease subunit
MPRPDEDLGSRFRVLTPRRADYLGRRLGASAIGLVMVLVAAAVFTPRFFTTANIVLVSQQIGIVGIAALGQTFCLLVAGIDLSVGAVSGLTIVVLAVVSAGSNERLALALVVGLGLGLGLGLVNAFLVTVRKAPPFIATFATFTLVEGGLLAWTNGAPSGSIPSGLTVLGAGSVDRVPVPLIVFAGLAVAAGVVLKGTTYGRRLYATGSNVSAARLSGVRTRTIVMSAYVLCALFAVLAGIVVAGYSGYVDNSLVSSINLNCIAAPLIGGTTFAGGVGGAIETSLGVVLLACVLSFMLFLHTGNSGELIFEGALMLGAVWLQLQARRQHLRS